MSFLGLFDYPKEIRNLRDQMPKNDRDTFINQYKKLPEKEKDAFKNALRKADGAAASSIFGQDLTKYNITADKTAVTVQSEKKSTVPGTVQAWKVAGPGAGPKDVVLNKDFTVSDNIKPNAVAGTVQAWKIIGPGAAPQNAVVNENFTVPDSIKPNAVAGTVQASKVVGPGAGPSVNGDTADNPAESTSIDPNLAAATAKRYKEGASSGEVFTLTDYRA